MSTAVVSRRCDGSGILPGSGAAAGRKLLNVGGDASVVHGVPRALSEPDVAIVIAFLVGLFQLGRCRVRLLCWRKARFVHFERLADGRLALRGLQIFVR